MKFLPESGWVKVVGFVLLQVLLQVWLVPSLLAHQPNPTQPSGLTKPDPTSLPLAFHPTSLGQIKLQARRNRNREEQKQEPNPTRLAPRKPNPKKPLVKISSSVVPTSSSLAETPTSQEHPIQPFSQGKLPDSAADLDLMVLVLSARSNFQHRNATRNTWGRHLPPHVALRFVVGQPCLVPAPYRHRATHDCHSQEHRLLTESERGLRKKREWTEAQKQEVLDLALEEEQKENGDLLRVPDIDVYNHLPDKLRSGIVWTYQNTGARFILKTDDEIYVNVNGIADIVRLNRHKANTPTVFTHKRCGHGPNRDVANKWHQERVGIRGWRFDAYPCFPLGQGYLVSRRLAGLISQHPHRLRLLQGEDTTLGIWAYLFGAEIFNRPDMNLGCTTLIAPHDSTSQIAQWRQEKNFLACGNYCSCNASLWKKDKNKHKNEKPGQPKPTLPSSSVSLVAAHSRVSK